MKGTPLNYNWHTGNAAEDGQDARGWLLGAFIDPAEGIRYSKDVEVKWANHHLGDKRDRWVIDHWRTTLVLLVEGTFKVYLTERNVTLANQGDYLVWGPGTGHSWEALAESVVLTVRWPSVPVVLISDGD